MKVLVGALCVSLAVILIALVLVQLFGPVDPATKIYRAHKRAAKRRSIVTEPGRDPRIVGDYPTVPRISARIRDIEPEPRGM